MTIEKLEIGKLNHLHREYEPIIVQDLLFVFDKINELIDAFNEREERTLAQAGRLIDRIRYLENFVNIKEKQKEPLRCPFCNSKPCRMEPESMRC